MYIFRSFFFPICMKHMPRTVIPKDQNRVYSPHAEICNKICMIKPCRGTHISNQEKALLCNEGLINVRWAQLVPVLPLV